MKKILVVDDEKNIRMTVMQSLKPLGLPIQTAINGEEALQLMSDNGPFFLVFLDLKMPGMNGIEALRKMRLNWPDTRIAIISAHGTIEYAVEAMKLGAVDFIQKPFSSFEIRELVSTIIQRETLSESNATDYQSLIELAKRNVTDGNLSAAQRYVGKAIAVDPAQPDAYNLLGALYEIEYNRLQALKFYRAALNIDPAYEPAWSNLKRATSSNKLGRIALGTEHVVEPDKKE